MKAYELTHDLDESYPDSAGAQMRYVEAIVKVPAFDGSLGVASSVSHPQKHLVGVVNV